MNLIRYSKFATPRPRSRVITGIIKQPSDKGRDGGFRIRKNDFNGRLGQVRCFFAAN